MDKDTKIPGKSTLHRRLLRTRTAADALPPPEAKRWTPRRKAGVVEAVLGGVISVEEVCRRYDLSVDEFHSRQNTMGMHGVPGLRTTRLQIYRDSRRRSASAGTELLSSFDVNRSP
jgi:transposase-like protein